jgi:CRP-like cAMP-binding protein
METSADINWNSALRGLTEDEVRQIEACLTSRDVPGRTPIFQQGDVADALFIVRSGRVRLIRHTEAGEDFTTGVWSDGYLIGLISAFLGAQRFLAAETVDQVTLRVFRRSDLLRCMEAVPRFALNIANLLALLASDSIQRAAPLALEPVEAKLGRVLVKLAEPAVPGNAAQGYVVQGELPDVAGRLAGRGISRAISRSAGPGRKPVEPL